MQTSPNTHITSNGNPGSCPLIDMELLLWPHKSLAKALMQTQKNGLAVLKAEHALLKELREIMRRQEDISMAIYEKLFASMSNAASPRAGTILPPDAVRDAYAQAIEGVRELGQAVTAAQIRSIETLRSGALARSHTQDESGAEAA